MNLPNLITLFRILLIPLLVILLLKGRTNLAFLTFVAAGFSDALDGFLARALKQKTRFGAFIDPVADKLLISTAYITLAKFRLLPDWLAVVVVSRDVLILLGFFVLMLNNKTFKIKPTFDSKITTFFQLITVCFVLGRDYLTGYLFLTPHLVYLTALITIVSGFHYIVIGFGILGQPNGNGTKF